MGEKQLDTQSPAAGSRAERLYPAITAAWIGGVLGLVGVVLTWWLNESEEAPPRTAPRLESASLLHLRRMGNEVQLLRDLLITAGHPTKVEPLDALQFRATVTGSAYWYLVMFNADSTIRIEFPTDGESIAREMDEFELSSPMGEKVWFLEEGPGLHGYLVVAASVPLSQDPSWWAKYRGEWPRSGEGVWRYKSHPKSTFRRLDSQLGEGAADAKRAQVAVFLEVCKNLDSRPDVELLDGVIVSVPSAKE